MPYQPGGHQHSRAEPRNGMKIFSLFILFCFSSIENIIYGQDVYRIGTLMELVRDLALSFADDGKRVKVS